MCDPKEGGTERGAGAPSRWRTAPLLGPAVLGLLVVQGVPGRLVRLARRDPMA